MLGYDNWQQDDLTKLYTNKYIWHNSTDPAVRAAANEENKKLRAMYGMGDEQDVSIGELSNYINLAEKQRNYDNSKNALLTNITNSAANENSRVRRSADAVANFNYNPNTDPAYQSYADMYNRQGQSAAKQTINNLNAASMGRNSSYSSAATAQVQQAYAQKASEMIPTLAQQAYEKLVNRYSIEKDMADSAFNRQLSAYNLVANQETQDINNDILRYNRESNKIQLEALPEQIKNDVESGRLAIELQKLNIDAMTYENRISAIAALIQETYGMRLADAEALAVDLNNQMLRKSL